MPQVTIYSRSNCQPCKAAKLWLERNNIPYTEVDGTSRIEEMEMLGSLSFPTIKIDAGMEGGTVLTGWHEHTMRTTLEDYGII